MKIKSVIILFLIFVTAFLLRFVGLSTYPPSLTIDEINNGYTAYSLLKTGEDEWGYKLPASFRSIGDYKPPILIYLTVPSIAVFGLNEFATRFPVALFSLLAVPALFILVKKYIFEDKRLWISLFATFLLATSSWQIVYSRSDFEAVIALTLTLVNVIFLFRFLKTKSVWDILFAGVFAFLAAVTYHSSKVFVPLINLSFFLINFKVFWKNITYITSSYRKASILLGLFFTGLLIFFVKSYIFGPGSTRAQMVFFTVDFDFARALMGDIDRVGLGIYRPVLTVLFWLKRYLEYFSANFYLYSGLELTITGQPGVGVLDLALYPFFLIGLVLLLTGKKLSFIDRRQSLFIFLWMLIGFLPASLANNPQQALRSINALIGVLLISVVGFVFVFDLIKSKWPSLIIFFVLLFSVIYAIDFGRFGDYYLVHYPKELSEFRQYGWKQMALYAYSVHGQYDNVYIDPRIGTDGPNTYGVPYLYFLFYSAYDPAKFHSRANADKLVSDFENFHFLEINWNTVNQKGNNLYIGSPWSFPVSILDDRHIVDKVMFLNGKSGIYAITNIPKK